MENSISQNKSVYESPDKAKKGLYLLNVSAKVWFIVAVLGQWIFAYYVAAFYGGNAFRGDLAAWDNVLPHGIIDGDAMGNFSLSAHLFLAVIIMIGGPAQFVKQVRLKAPTFHHWNGRVYVLMVCLTSIFGLYMMWTRGTVGGLIMHIGTSVDGILIILFSILTIRYAILRKIKIHQRWATRLFIVVSGVWFFRVGLMLWLIINGGPVGIDFETFTGPFLSFWTFGQYLLPLAILELYFLVHDRAGVFGRFAMAVGLFIVTAAMGVGIFAATMGMWIPRM